MLIGINGLIGSGKTTIAEHLVRKQNFKEISFATSLKKACQELFLLSDEQVFGSQLQKATPDPRWYNCNPRTILQFVGTDLLRKNMDKIMPGLGENIFVHHTSLWYEDAVKKNPDIRIVISDVRFENEVDFIKKSKGYLIKVVRPTEDGSTIIDHTTHSSETELGLKEDDYFDKIFVNDGTLEELHDKIDLYIQSIIDLQ